MNSRKLAVLSAEDGRIPGHHECWNRFPNSGIKTGYGGRPVSRRSRQLRRDGKPDEDKGLKILAREVNNIAARNVPNSQADWLWDCSTPSAALTGIFVSGGANRFVRKTATSESFFIQTRCTHSALKGHGFQPCRYWVRKSWPLGPEGSSPQRLKPGAIQAANGTPEGVPLQGRSTERQRTEPEPSRCATAALPVPHIICACAA
jgi:hypothetical protein